LLLSDTHERERNENNDNSASKKVAERTAGDRKIRRPQRGFSGPHLFGRSRNTEKHGTGASSTMKAVLARRIERLQVEFRRAKTEGRDTAPFLRRSRSLSNAYLAVMEP
tara:strand:- start:1913 stop:2239 length:327 start_codon:yes stop_codon:yes gene_type:complete